VKFKVDENLPDELSQLFHDAGWDSFTIEQQQLGGAIDPHIAEVCAAEARILVTFDRGFSNIRAYSSINIPGIIVFRLKSQDKRHVLAISAQLIEALKQRALQREIWIVHETRIRAM
jgi:predicted nuclease of predicted toxin-antitoxin system